jgi:hypothetical protein
MEHLNLISSFAPMKDFQFKLYAIDMIEKGRPLRSHKNYFWKNP